MSECSLANSLRFAVLMLGAMWSMFSQSAEIYVLEQGLAEVICANERKTLFDVVREDIQSRGTPGLILTSKGHLKKITATGSAVRALANEQSGWARDDFGKALNTVQKLHESRQDVDGVVIYARGSSFVDLDSVRGSVTVPSPLSLELRLLNTGESASATGPNPTVPQLVVSGLTCRSQEALPSYVDEIRQRIADRLGVALDQIGPTTDLVGDLGIGYAEAYEVLAWLCDEYEVPLPDGDGFTKVDAIVAYLTETPTEVVSAGAAVTTRGSSDNTREAPYTQTIYFATDRESRTAGSELLFSGGRAQDGEISYGTCQVSIPANHKTGRLETPFLGINLFSSPKKYIQVSHIESLTPEMFWGQVANHAEAGVRDVAVFIHGYNVDFDEAARRTAQLAFDLEFEGVPMMFSWPSNGSLLSYVSDLEDIQWSVAHIAEFLNKLVDNTAGGRIHLIAHSMGSQGLIRALNMIVLQSGTNESTPLFGNVILAAPDFDAQLFKQQIAPRVIAAAERWTVYASDRDFVLRTSEQINSAKRLGTPLIPVAGADVIDASGVEVTPWNVPESHSYFATKSILIRDVHQTLRGIPARVRGLLRRTSGGLGYWELSLKAQMRKP